MIKREELSDPRSCMSRAHHDEMAFVLLGRDVAAPVAIRAWITERIRLGKNSPTDEQITEALTCAIAMERSQATKGAECSTEPVQSSGWITDAASESIAAAEARADRMAAIVAAEHPRLTEILAKLKQAEAETAKLREDAERYRWLRDNQAYVGIANHHHRSHLPIRERTGWTMPLICGNDDSLDAAIDAARKGA